MKYLSIVFALGALPLFSQPVSFGVVGGVPFTNGISISNVTQNLNFSTQDHYVIGPVFQINLPLRFGVEIDGLYRGLGYDFTADNPIVAVRARASQWEIPVMAKWEILPGP